MYFVYPFGVDSTPAPIPPTAASTTLSYQYGYGTDFELPLNSNPAAEPISRVSFNQLMNDITSTLQNLYQFGTPPWISAAQNLGVSFPYPIYARVYYIGQVWENQVAGNTVTPGTMGDETWIQISAQADSVEPGMMIDFAGVVANPTAYVGYLKCDGSSYPRTTYPDLFTAITFVEPGNTNGTDGTVTGLSNALSTMFVGMYVEGVNITANSTIASIQSNTAITLNQTTAAVGTGVNVTFFPWGGAATVFNVPSFIDNVAAGSGGTLFQTAGVGNAVGNGGGAQTYTMQSSDVAGHVHPPGGGLTSFLGNKTSGLTAVPAITGNADSSANTGSNNSGSPTAMPIVQPTKLVTKLIKI